jgi:DNA-binding transcriptional LysR family regulator
MEIKPKISLIIGGETLSFKFFETLDTVNKTRSQREAAKILGISHAVINRRIIEAEKKLNMHLVISSGAGSQITDDGLKLLKQYHQLIKRLNTNKKSIICGGYISSGLLEVLASQYGLDVMIYQSEDDSALHLFEMGLVDILTLDDPVKAFMRDMDFIPIAQDHLVLVTPSGEDIMDLSELEGKKFVEVTGSAQRLAWNTMDNEGINYKIVNVLKSPYEALKMVKNSQDLYTFLNKSFINGSDVLKEDTNHILTMVLYNPDDKKFKGFVEYVGGRGRKLIKELGFRGL